MANIIPVVFCFDNRIILGASVSIKSMIDCAKSGTIYDIRIFHSDLKLEDQKLLTSLVEGTSHRMAFHYISPSIFKDAPCNKHSWTELVYYRLLIPEILVEYEKAIYSDVDVLFKQDLSELYSTDISQYDFAAVAAEKNVPTSIGHKYFEENKNEYIFWSGFMLMNCKKFREEGILGKLIKNAKLFYDRLKFFDLDLVNITCDKILPIDMKYCVMQNLYYFDEYKNSKEYKFLSTIYSDEEIENSIKNTSIVHYGGKPGKPWRMRKPYSDYQAVIDKLPKELIRYTFRDLRKRLFNKV